MPAVHLLIALLRQNCPQNAQKDTKKQRNPSGWNTFPTKEGFLLFRGSFGVCDRRGAFFRCMGRAGSHTRVD